MSKFKALEKALNYQFRRDDLITEALTHKSYKKPYNNERLEFLGDAVLDLIVGEYLFNKFPKENEGLLSKIRASLVNEKGFAKLALDINLGKCLLISSAEENNCGRTKPSLLSNAFEAIIGAIYLESDLQTASRVAVDLIEDGYETIDLNSLSKDFKTTLQELTQAEFGETPTYKMVRAFGPDHKKEFEISIELQHKVIATAIGRSKKEAQQKSAEIALKKLQGVE
ncbi:ribonuclease III [Sulfurovum sp. bin170]|uniref:ribonuclease III n=1 Tax=Sulfurovum sp. bin170 TaxID=2695268 RepID=UPI0013DF828C|nr:ribonuclease III [Sulfurovum sp. bin170]NEW61130.1 ribonuclease III [Sulfurovum sp. bin170]